MRTTYFSSARVNGRSYTRNDPVMRGWMIMRSPDDSRNTACLARRVTCSIVLPRSALIRRGFDTSRSTSVFFSSARAIRDPSRRGAISRIIVSTSGSSGTPSPVLLPADLPPGDVAPPGLALEGNALGPATARLRGDRHRGSEPGHTQHPAAGGTQSPLVVAVGAGVKHDHVVAQLLGVRKPDRDAFFRIVGIAARCQDRGDRGPLDRQHVLR